MLDAVRELLAGEQAWVVGGAIRDELLGRPVLDLDVAVSDPKEAAEAYGRRQGGAVFRLSGPHGAWRVAYRDGRTVDFTPLAEGGIEADLAARDFSINAIARPLAGGDEVDPFDGRGDLERRVIRATGDTVFRDDPLRLLRAVRLAEQLGFGLDPETAELVRRDAQLAPRPAGERILGELEQITAAGYRNLAVLGILEHLGGSLDRLDRVEDGPTPLLLVAVFGVSLERLPISNGLRRYARTLLAAELPADLSPRAIHRFRRSTEPWATDAARLLDGGDELIAAIEAAREVDPAQPLVHGDELGLPPGPEIGRMLERIAEERAAGTISTRDEALELIRREARSARPRSGPGEGVWGNREVPPAGNVADQ